MSTVYNLVSLYKTDIMTESATREFLIDVLRKAFPNSNIYTGQKRVVITDPLWYIKLHIIMQGFLII